MKKILGMYTNGNYKVTMLEDGTKIRFTKEDEFKPEFPESMDLKISNRCMMNCAMCHENSTPDGEVADLMNAKFIDTLNPYTEIALGGGDVLLNDQLVPFLLKCKQKKIIISMTVHENQFMDNLELIRKLRDDNLIYGIGISVFSFKPEVLKAIKEFPNAVIHVINGLVSVDDLSKLYGKGYKLLILGYKMFRRGISNYEKTSTSIECKKQELYDKLDEITKNISVVSFDNLALKQLNVKRLMSEVEWEEFYMGDDGSHTMYIDLVKKEFAISSISEKRYELMDDIRDMFKIIMEEKNSKNHD